MPRAFVVLVMGVLAGCSSQRAASDNAGSSSAPPAVLNVQTQGAWYSSATPAALFVAGETRELRVQASDGAVVWGALGALSPASLLSGHSTLAVVPTAAAANAGNASVVTQSGAGSTFGSGGTLDFQLQRGSVSGHVTGAAPADLNGTFSGALSVECWVPEAEIPGGSGTQGGIIDGDGTQGLVLDSALASATCAPLKAWLPK